jgi:hypothetical protein
MTRILPALAAIVTAGALTACGGDPESAGPSMSASSATPSATVPSTPPATSSSTPSSTSSSKATTVRTATELKKALLDRRDLPPGFTVEPEQAGDDGGMDVTSEDPKCAALVRLLKTDTAPGSKATAARSLSRGQQPPFIDESLDAMGSAGAVATLQTSFRAAVASCPKVTLTIAGQGTSSMSVRKVTPPQEGTGPFAVRFTAAGGPLNGLVLTMVTTGVDDAVLAMTFIATAPADIAGATHLAVDKAERVLS